MIDTDNLDDLAASLDSLLDSVGPTHATPALDDAIKNIASKQEPVPATATKDPLDSLGVALAEMTFPESMFRSALEAVIKPSAATDPAQLQATLAQFETLDPKEVEALRAKQATKARAAAAVVYSAAVSRLGELVTDPQVQLSLPATLDVIKTLGGPAGADPKEQAKSGPIAQIVFNIDRPSQTAREVITLEATSG